MRPQRLFFVVAIGRVCRHPSKVRPLFRFIFVLAAFASVISLLTIQQGSSFVVQERFALDNSAKYNMTSSYQEVNFSEHTIVVGKRLPTKGFLTIGIPSIKRVNGNIYLLSTLQSILSATSVGDKTRIRIVVFLADLDASYNAETTAAILKRYGDHVTSGLLTVVRVRPAIYPHLDGLKRNFGDSSERVRWRSKQVADYSILFAFSRDLSDYYVQLEDDVTCAEGFVGSIRDGIEETNRSTGGLWTMLEFSELGFIGKLFRSSELERLAQYMLMFYVEQPVDWLMVSYRLSAGQRRVFLRRPTLFQHQGLKSSFNHKKDNDLKDRFFQGDPSSSQYGDNPQATVWSTMPHHKEFLPINAYDALKWSFFWAEKAGAGDAVYVTFDVTQRVSRVVVTTGNAAHPKDILTNGRVELGLSLYDSLAGHAVCAELIQIATFGADGRAESPANLTEVFPLPVRCLKISVDADQPNWVVFANIAVYLQRQFGTDASLTDPPNTASR